jgi:small-conductance mechanosensitive channel
VQWLLHHLRFPLFSLSGRPVTLLALFALLVTVVVSVLAGLIARRALQRLLLRRGTAEKGLAYALGRIAQYVVVVSGVLFGLDNVGLSLTTLATVGAVLTVGIGFGLQNIAQNFISGLILLLERPVQQGDFVSIGDLIGRVDEIALRATRVISRDGVAVIVPNSVLITATVINLSAGMPNYRARVKVGVAYGSDLAKVRDLLLELAAAHEEVLADPAPHVFFRAFGDSSLDFELTVWLADPQHDPYVTSDLRFAIDAAFRLRGIEIPFPQRELHFRADAAGAPGVVAAAAAARSGAG